MPHVRVGDVNLHFELIDCTEPWRSGHPPAVLLHALGTDRRIWLYQVPAFCGRVPTLLVDLRGHGQSRAPAGDWSIADMALDVVRLLRHLGIEKAHVVGVSLGGMVAQQIALDYPYATASLVLASTISGGAANGAPLEDEVLAFATAHSMREIAEARVPAAFSESVNAVMRGHLIEQMALLDKDAYLCAARAVRAFDVTSRLGEIASPTLVAVGEADRLVPLSSMEDLATRIGGARLVRLPGAGHLGNMERPREFNQAVLDFLGV